MTLIFHTKSENETIALGKRLGALLEGGNVLLLDGDLGAGKTRFAKGVAHGLGAAQELTSPTFNLVLEYPLDNAEKSFSHPPYQSSQPVVLLRHFDLYRLDTAEQLDDLDYFGLLEEDDAVSIVEWGSKFSRELPLDYVQVQMRVDAATPTCRTIEFTAKGTRSSKLLERFTAIVEGASRT